MIVDEHPDPRVSGEYTRDDSGIDGEGGVILVGVVHNHPASRYRVREVIRTRRPDVVALELPPVSVPLFERYAEDNRTPPAFGGEMSAAIQAAETAQIVGVDGPSGPFLGRVAKRLARERPTRETVGRVLSSLLSVTKRAAQCRLAASVARWTDIRVEVDDPTTYNCTTGDDPAKQAADERTHVRRAEAVMNTSEPSAASTCHRRTREAHIAERITTLRRRGDVVAIMGVGHLDAVAERLAEASR